MIVLDCSAGIEIARNTELGNMLQQLILPEEEIIAPNLYKIEATNVAWKYTNAGILSKQQAKDLLDDALSIPDAYIDCTDMISETFALAETTSHSAYDCFYLVLARRHDAALFTADKKLQQLCETLHIECVVYADSNLLFPHTRKVSYGN